MNQSDECYLHHPELPQYGRELTCCHAGLPQAAWWTALAWCGCAVVALTFVGVVAKNLPKGAPVLPIVIFTMFASIIACWFAMQKLALQPKRQALFVFERGVHLNERLWYMVPNGQWMSFCSGVRQVSLPWRVLKQFEIHRVPHGSEDRYEATVKLPDGRQMLINTADGPESLIALDALVKNLGQR